MLKPEYQEDIVEWINVEGLSIHKYILSVQQKPRQNQWSGRTRKHIMFGWGVNEWCGTAHSSCRQEKLVVKKKGKSISL